MQKFYKNLPVLVTGGAGFIGSYIVEKLVSLGAKVTIIDDLSSGNLKNLDNVAGKYNFINKSITDMDACLQATCGQKIIFHLAAFISVPESIAKPDICHKINVDGTFNILEAARINKVERLVFSSSAATYGPTTAICKEDMAPDPQSPYGTTKLIGEYYFKQYATNYNLNTVVLRYFNVFGDRQNPNGAYAAVVAKFTDSMRNNKQITIFGDGLQTRDFVPVESVAEANLTVAMLDKNLMNGQIFNVGTGKSVTLLDLVEMLKEKFPNYKQELQFKPARDGDIKYSQADCSKYQSLNI
ncbi:MAG: hypothetical protein UR12_C0013G0013 [candidate division TM6 bacterium GW2011_GWF2_30_66]|jgi:nucleoside-diphosphate-sugar epimerase|nr:MAG: hypothetical protein UR12_C0013G0013 [candidate division TM6 bacterium GW2011_GWF2_30_66]